jgi:hypothetical protein
MSINCSSIKKEESEEELQMNNLPHISNKFESKLNNANRKSNQSPTNNNMDKLEAKTTLSNTSHFTSNSSHAKHPNFDS